MSEFIKLVTNWGGGCEWDAPEECVHGEAEYVDIKSFDAAQSELSALREELAHSECMHQNYKIDAQVYKDALTAAEQRNADLCKHLTQAHRFVEATYGMADSGILTAGKDKSTTWNIDESKAILQPYESGASE